MTAFKDWLNGLTSKTTPVDADELYVRDSSGTPGSKKLTWANLKATLANTFLSLTGGTVAGGTRTSSGSTLTITETLNNAGVTFPGALVVDVTDTASNAASLLADFKVGGASKFNVKKDGSFTSASGASFQGDINVNGATVYAGNGFQVGNGGSISFSNGTVYSANIRIDAADTLAQRNGTNAQTFRLYNTYTDASNYERGFMRWSSNVLEIGAEKAGTGADRSLALYSLGGYLLTQSGSGTSSRARIWNAANTATIDLYPLKSAGMATIESGPTVIAIGPNDGAYLHKFRSDGSMEFSEVTAPAAPATNGVRIYAEDNGSGKTRLMALFATGAAVQIAIEP